MNRSLIIWTGLCALLLSGSRAAGNGDEVVVVYNTRVPESRAVAEHYARMRQVPASQVFGFSLSTGDEMSRQEFRNSLEQPLAKKISSQKLWRIRSETIPGTNGENPRIVWKPVESRIRYAVLCYGVPYRIKPDDLLKESGAQRLRPELQRNEAAVDTELALLPLIEQHLPLTGPSVNPLYGATNSAVFHPTNGILMVTRLDGPSAEIARELVDKAIAAETNGLWGRAYIDLRNISDTNYAQGDAWLQGAAEVCRHLGYETIVDSNATTFSESFPMSQIGFYAGWYDGDASGPFARPTVEFLPGAFAYHLHSFSAANLRSPKANWVGPFLAKGATITMGTVAEPYLGGTPDVAVFASRFLFNGFNFGEAAYAAQSVLSWQVTIVGDPLYRPCAVPAQQLHEELTARKSPWLEWSFLRLVNLNLVRGLSTFQMANFLDRIPLTRESAVLSEKLGNLYAAQGKPSSAVDTWLHALTLNPSPLQKLRLRLALGDKLSDLDRLQDAIEQYSKILQENPDYADRAEIYRRMAQWATRLGKPEAAANYEQRSREHAR